MDTVATGRRHGPGCRVCGHAESRFVFEADAIGGSVEPVRRFFSCGRCRSLLDSTNVGPPYAGDPDAELTDAAPSVKFYLEVGAGVIAFATILCLLRQAVESGPARTGLRLLDIGSAFPFLPSMARTFGWEGTAVEPSGMGRLGGRILGIPVLNHLLEDTDLPTGSFDAIVASEVIEHVQDPRAFVASITRYLAPDGLLLLTTPNGELLGEGPEAEREWLEGLSPGHHLTLLSPMGLSDLLAEHGLVEVRTVCNGGSSGKRQLVVLAARRPGLLPQRLDWDARLREAQDLMLAYLDGMVVERERTGLHDALYRGALFRLMHMRVDRGEYALAMPYLEKLAGMLPHDVENGALDATVKGFADYLARFPAFAGLLCYYRGMVELNHLGDPSRATASFATAARLCKLEDSLGYFPRVGWFERARLHEGIALLRCARHAEAAAVFDALLAARARVPPEHLEQLYRHKIMAHLELGDYERIREFVTELAPGASRGRDIQPGGLPGPRGLANGPWADLLEMATLYRQDRSALLRVNRVFDALRRPRRLLARMRGEAT